MTARVAIPEDLDHDPTYLRQRIAASAAVGLLLNELRGVRGVFDMRMTDQQKFCDAIEAQLIVLGVIVFDDFHHSPACPANHYHRRRIPTGPCCCDAAKLGIR